MSRIILLLLLVFFLIFTKTGMGKANSKAQYHRFHRNRFDTIAVTNPRQIKWFKDLLKVAGIQSGYLKLYESDETNVAQYFNHDHQHGYIIFNPQTFYNRPEEIFIGVIAHEIGHFIYHHENREMKPDLELDADYYIGFLTRRIGFKGIDSAYNCVNLLATNGETASHPAADARLVRIKNGWDNSVSPSSLNSFATNNPRIVWDRDTLKIEEKIVACTNGLCGWDTNGVYYDEATNSTYQLINFREEYKGVGKLVNNRTNVCFMRTKSNKFLVYVKGKVLKLASCSQAQWAGNRNDVIIRCYDQTTHFPQDFILKDYDYTKYFILSPAYSL